MSITKSRVLYFCCMHELLDNPVYNALLTGDQRLAQGEGNTRYFDTEVSPFVGFEENYKEGFSDLHEQLPPGRKILYAIPSAITEPPGWKIHHEIIGLQFVYEKAPGEKKRFDSIVPLSTIHVEQMIALSSLTRPGPFGQRTIDFGSYFGIFEGDKLVAMTGQRLHPGNYTEISAVCTHPEHTGRGYAFNLIEHQLQLILEKEQQPFLHVRADNKRATDLYERMGFTVSRNMNFYFMKKQ